MAFCTVNAYSQKELVADNWYTYESEDDFKGFMHQEIEEAPDSYYISTFLGIKTSEGKRAFYNIKSTCYKDKYLTHKSYSVKTTGDNGGDIVYSLSGVVERSGDSLRYTINIDGGDNAGEHIEMEKYPVADFFNLFFLITKLDSDSVGKVLTFQGGNVTRRDYEEEYIEYKGEETLIIKGKEYKVNHFERGGDNIGESGYWVDENNVLIKASIDYYKDLIKCNKEDIDSELLEIYKNTNQ